MTDAEIFDMYVRETQGTRQRIEDLESELIGVQYSLFVKWRDSRKHYGGNSRRDFNKARQEYRMNKSNEGD